MVNLVHLNYPLIYSRCIISILIDPPMAFAPSINLMIQYHELITAISIPFAPQKMQDRYSSKSIRKQMNDKSKERKQKSPALRANARIIQMHFFFLFSSPHLIEFSKSKCNDNHQHLNLAQNPPRFVILAPGRAGKSVVSASLSPYDGNRGGRDADCV